MKRTLIMPALLALAACSTSPADEYAKARAAFAQHDYRTARIHLASALTVKPGDQAMLLLQARTLIALGDGDGAGAALEKLTGTTPATGELAELSAEAALLRRAPDVALALLGAATQAEADRLRALAFIQKDDLDKAEEYFAKAMKSGGNARTFADYCRFKLLQGDLTAAKDLAARAELADPEGLDTLLVAGQLALKQGDLKHGLDRYERAAKLYPDSLAALTAKAATLGDLGRIDEMLQIVNAAANFAPKDLTVIYLKARGGVAKQDWESVRTTIRPVEISAPQLHPVRLLYAEALLRLGQPELARAQIVPIARAQPGNRTALTLLAETQQATGDAATALTTLQPVILDPTARPEELALAAKIARAAGSPQAAALAQRAKNPAPRALAADLSEGDSAIRAQDWARAIVAYDRVLSVTDGRNAMVLNNMAYSQLMVGNFAKAQSFADRAVREAPQNASVLDTAGWVRFKAGRDLGEAKRLLRLAAGKAPANSNIRAHLAEAERAPG